MRIGNRFCLPAIGLAAILLGCGLAASALAAEDYVWVEGEAAKARNVAVHGWYNSIKKIELSGKEWISNYGKTDGTADYDLKVPADGDYAFWVRANTVAKPRLSYQIDNDRWTEIDLGQNVFDRVNLASDNKPDMRFVAWCKAGQMRLSRGSHTIRFKFHGEIEHHGALDCFLFTLRPFTPDGQRKPGEKLGYHDPGTWAFEPDVDTFDVDSLLDLRHLNERAAGESGFIKRTAGGDFSLGDGRPVRFWAVNTNLQSKHGMEQLALHARWLAKRGVNMVRFHGQLCPKTPGSRVTDVDRKALDQCWQLVAAMKKEGIYTTISPYWAVSCNVQPSWNVPGFGSGKPMALLFWDETLQQGYKAWVKALFTEKNPYTGISLARDPAVAIIQIQNEDSMLFWSMQSVQGEQRKILGRKFAQFLETKYGSTAKAQAAWGEAKHKDDDPAGGVFGLYSIWEITQRRGNDDRLADQIKFYARTMHGFNRQMADYYRSLGCEQLVNAGNWKTADGVRMLDVERLCYAVNDVIGANKYYGSPHVNPHEGHKAGYLISKGDRFASVSALMNPRGLPLNIKQVAGLPTIIPESTWVPPLRYQSEGPFLVAAYGSLCGVDIYYWFATSDVGFGRPMGKWQLSTPALMGGFPAASLAFRKGYIQQGKPVVSERRAYDDLWRLRTPIIAEDTSFDPNRASEDLAPRSNVKRGVDPLAFLVGPVQVQYGGDPAKSSVVDLAPHIDADRNIVRSITGEIELDHGLGLCKLNAPKVQGVTGFLSKAGRIKLDSIEVRCENEYATLLVVAMDDRPLGDSRKMLAQVGTIARPFGWKTRDVQFAAKAGAEPIEGKTIVDRGSAPWNVTNTEMTLTVRNRNITKATVLDANGLAVRDISGRRNSDGFAVELPPDAMYLLLQ
ncbi:MAG: hypothetical protein HQ581_05940 [Planctomycetes bacterium]|nr:hypothetical protein [Planctomycetota bacterium]